MTISFQTESWIWMWYFAGISIASARLLARVLHLGSIQKFQIDDWLMVAAMMTHTAFLVTIDKEANYNSNLIQAGHFVNAFTAEGIHARVYGIELTLAEQTLLCVGWLMRTEIYRFYCNVTPDFNSNWFVRALGLYVGSTLVVMEILYFGVVCHPLHNYWAVPTPGVQCTAAIHRLIANADFSISSDLMLQAIAFYVFVRCQAPKWKKIILFPFLVRGAYRGVSAALNTYDFFTHTSGSERTYWYVRESSIALIVSNLPFALGLLQRIFKSDALAIPHSSGETTEHEVSRCLTASGATNSRTCRERPMSRIDSSAARNHLNADYAG